MKRILSITSLILIAVLALSLSFSGQTKARKTTKKTQPKKTQTETVQPPANPEPAAVTKTPEKKNERPAQAASTDYEAAPRQEAQKKNQSPKSGPATSVKEEPKNLYAYEFSQPDFMVSRIIIEHDENGKGVIKFEKKGFGGELMAEPIQLSSVSLEKVKNLFQTLNFLDSTEEYQSANRQFAHLGTMKIRQKSGGRDRATEFNWTENKDARALADEYRKIGEQFLWILDISVAVENQPLEAPKLMDKLDTLVKRNEISDPAQMIPLLKKLSDDERIPLIARNHATRIVKEIEKNLRK